MHGRLDRALCAGCGHHWPAPAKMTARDCCPARAAPLTRPDVVWFGEIHYHMDRIMTHLAEAEVFADIGTSGQVYPAAGFVQEAAVRGAHTVELNLDPSGAVADFAEIRPGLATRTVPAWVDDMLQRLRGATAGP